MPVNGLFLRQQLEHVQNDVVTQDFPEMLMASGAAVDISDELPSGAETYSYKILTVLGEAKILANGATDIPLVNAFAEKRTGFIRTIANAYAYTLEDLEGADFAGMNLDSSMAIAAREVIERKLDVLGYEGDAENNLLGMINFPNVPVWTSPNNGNSNGGTSSTEWQHKTNEQVYDDLRNFAAATRVATNGAYNPMVIALPQDQFERIVGSPFPNNSASGETILSFFLKTQRATPAGVQTVIPMPYLQGKGTGGVDMMVSYIKRPDLVKFHVPLDFEQRPNPERDFSFRVPCRMRTGGIEVRKPLSMRYGEGI
jgi:hypothetical protein